MKNITLFSTVFLLSVVLTACGGGASSGGGVIAPPVNPNLPNPSSSELIIDNGRGTVNNQDTEIPKQ